MTDPAPDDDPPADLTGRTVGDFHILRKLGQGGMGTVYLARQQSLKREVALKFLKRELTEKPVALARFQAEAEAVARISHPNIVQVYSIGDDDGHKYMALEYVEGRNLRDYLDRKGPLDAPVAVAVFRQVAAALQRASEVGIVHRDIKPENILLTRKAEVKVTDFGLSRYFGGTAKPLSLTQSGMTLGTPLYMSPEQVQGKAVDHRSDLYSLGVTAYHALAGHPPYKGANAFEVAVQHVQSLPEPLEAIRPDLPPELLAIVKRLMERHPDDRYGSAKEVMRDLARVGKGQPGAGPSAVELPASPSLPSASMPAAVAARMSSMANVPVETSAPPSRGWLLPVVGVAVAVAALAGGWLVAGSRTTAEPPRGTGSGPGLPDARPPSPVVAGAETELREKFRNREPSAQPLKDGLRLALFLVREHRYDEAEAVFAEVEALQRGPGVPADMPTMPALMGKLGHGVVLAWRDRPADSVKAFEEAAAKIQPIPYRKRVEPFFFELIEFSEAVAEALNRNAENLKASNQKLPAKLEWLRTPSGLMGGPPR